MADWTSEQMYRDFWNRPLMYPMLRLYNSFMNIKRYDRMPYYIAPAAGKVVDYEDVILKYIDWLVDAHEEPRNTQDYARTFYSRSVYVMKNFHRYQNDTLCNLMFDVKASKAAYDKVNAVADQQTALFYLATSGLHITAFMYLSFFFRYRRVGAVPTLLIAGAYYSFFENVNNIAYKLLVDRSIIRTARNYGYEAQVQPVGTFKNRGLNFK